MKQKSNQRKATPEVVVLAAVTLKDALASLFGPQPVTVTIVDSTR